MNLSVGHEDFRWAQITSVALKLMRATARKPRWLPLQSADQGLWTQLVRCHSDRAEICFRICLSQRANA
jgi:hypothetical protein